MKRISDLAALLKGMSPRLSDGRFFMASVDESHTMALASHLEYILCIYREKEGLAVVFSDDIRDDISRLAGEPPVGPFALITLDVYSDPMAVGFLARVTDALAEKGISVNTFSAYHHDHLLVPYGRKDDAMKVLNGLQGSG